MIDFEKPIKYSVLILSVVISLVSCRTEPEQSKEKPALSDEQLADINRQLMIKDRERIVSYIERKGLDMKETPTGLWVSGGIENNGSIEEGDMVTLEYTCSLLDGTLVYDSAIDGKLEFEVGKSDIPSGLNEGIRLLDKGSTATFILPGYLGYGLLGDDNRIPARSVLVYRVEVTGVK